MDVRCERCRAQYVFDDEQVTPAGLPVQCTNCGHVFRVKKKELVVTVPVKPGEIEGTPMPATAAAPRSTAARSPLPPPTTQVQGHEPERAREWRVRQGNGNVLTFRELTTLQKWIVEQKVSREDEISVSGEQQWKRLGAIDDLASFFQVVDAAERSKARDVAASPGPTARMPPGPVHGAATEASPFHAPPPTYPPPPLAAPPYAAGWAVHEPAAVAPQRPQLLPPPVHEVDLGPDDDMAPGKRGGRTWIWLGAALLLALGAGGAAAYLRALGPIRTPTPPAVATLTPPSAPPAPAAAEAVAPEPPPAEPPAPEPRTEPGATPEPLVEQVPASPPEPIVKPVVSPPASHGPKVLLAQARKLREAGNLGAALDLYDRLVAQDPGNAEALVGRGLCYLDLERYLPAEASFGAALRIEPQDPDALLGLAETYRFEGKKPEAIRQYERYLAEHPAGDEADVARNAIEELRE